MDFAFWRRNKRLPDVAKNSATRSSTAIESDAIGRAEPAAALRARARRRFIGAAALLLTVAIVVPMLLDPEPRPVPDSIAIDIPSEKTPFTPRLSLPPVPAPAEPVPEPAPHAAAPPGAPTAVASAPRSSADVGKAIEPRKATTVDKTEEQRARALLEGKKPGAPATMVAASGAFAVQAAATASEAAALELAERLRKAGFTPYTEKVETKDGPRHRVRVGPYATRDEAERSRARLKALGIGGNLVAL
jgi:DedD protein